MNFKKSIKKRNLLEVRNGLVHADNGRGDDFTLCGVTTETACNEKPFDYDMDNDKFSFTPLMLYTAEKITCPVCIATIKHCCKLGLKSIDKEALSNEEW